MPNFRQTAFASGNSAQSRNLTLPKIQSALHSVANFSYLCAMKFDTMQVLSHIVNVPVSAYAGIPEVSYSLRHTLQNNGGGGISLITSKLRGINRIFDGLCPSQIIIHPQGDFCPLADFSFYH
jgi:hypothetical protein